MVISQKNEIINSSNATLSYKTFGKGKPLLIINGGPGMNSEGFSGIAEEISKFNYQTITYDQRGTGKSIVQNPGSENITMDLMVEDMENLRKHLKLEKWSILGHSFGGLMAAYYATKHPDRIEKLIFSSSGGINMNFTTYIGQTLNNILTESQRNSLAMYQKKMDNGDTSMETRIERAKVLANAYVYDKSKADIIAQRLTQINFDINGLVIGNLHKINFNCSKSFKNFRQPILVLQGKNDIIKVETAEEIAAAFPNSKLVLINNCGHYGWLDAKEVYLNAIKSFLNS